MNSEDNIPSFDDDGTTQIVVSCHRETERLTRVLRCFQRALARCSSRARRDELRTTLLCLHDHKGILKVTWVRQPDLYLVHCVELAWKDEGEHQVEHDTGNPDKIIEVDL